MIPKYDIVRMQLVLWKGTWHLCCGAESIPLWRMSCWHSLSRVKLAVPPSNFPMRHKPCCLIRAEPLWLSQCAITNGIHCHIWNNSRTFHLLRVRCNTDHLRHSILVLTANKWNHNVNLSAWGWLFMKPSSSVEDHLSVQAIPGHNLRVPWFSLLLSLKNPVNRSACPRGC